MTIVFVDQAGAEVEGRVEADIAPRVGEHVFFGIGYPDTRRYEVLAVTHSYYRRSAASHPRFSLLECVVRRVRK